MPNFVIKTYLTVDSLASKEVKETFYLSNVILSASRILPSAKDLYRYNIIFIFEPHFMSAIQDRYYQICLYHPMAIDFKEPYLIGHDRDTFIKVAISNATQPLD